MPERPAAVLRIETHPIPARRSAFDKVAEDPAAEIELLGVEGTFPAPWLGEPVSGLQKMAATDERNEATALMEPRR